MHNSSITSTRRWTGPVPVPRPSLAARGLRGAIALYQRLSAGRIAPCRFYPSCSHYAAEAIEIHGAWRGSLLATRRLLRCRPFGPHGVDLVPEPKHVRSTLS
ncbi:MAG: membrane protein insertion efficiency factor YidD [Acidimicrobiales bacterium]|jgi:putative membrane protein insertion efficiency factor